MTTIPLLTGAEVREIRLELGMSQSELARALGFTGNTPGATNWMSQIEREVAGRHLDFAKANLLMAIRKGYKPVMERGA